jgi:hypothetical protein
MTENSGYPIPGALLVAVIIGLFLWLGLSYLLLR